MATSVQPYSDLAIPPGEYLSEVLEDLEMSQVDLARRMGRPEQVVSEIVSGAKRITSETALQLERVTRVPAHVWTGLEEEYQLTTARAAARAQAQSEAAMVDLETYRVLARLGFVEATRDRQEKVRELWRFFGVASLHSVPELRAYGAAFRVSTAGGVSPYALAAWLRCGELLAAEVEVEAYDASSLRARIQELRALTRESLDDALPKARAALATCGVALITLPHFPKTRAYGATFWTSPEKVVVQMSHRGAWSDVFWFSLFHELGHVLRHGKRHVYLEQDAGMAPEARALEEEADAFASERLIPERALNEFLTTGPATAARVTSFADHVGVASGIVVGRLQHLGVLQHDQLNDLRSRHGLADTR
jgi:HTH-type transcriptional regulator/antitoxin HigA